MKKLILTCMVPAIAIMLNACTAVVKEPTPTTTTTTQQETTVTRPVGASSTTTTVAPTGRY